MLFDNPVNEHMEVGLESQRNTPEISPQGKGKSSFSLRQCLINILVAYLWAFFAYSNIHLFLKSPELSLQTFLYLGLFIRNSSLTILFLIRRPAKTSSNQMKEWVAALVGTFLGFFYSPTEAYPLIPSYHHSIPYIIMTLAIVLSLSAIFSLGRSFGLVPANRGIQTGGLYSIIRHPIYTCYIFFDITFLAIRFSYFNLLIFCLSFLSLYLRAVYEERFLFQDFAYRQYAQKTRYRFIPRII
jgi:protein-S-isoprenylcysteine O-methyltransferase Ste14